MSRAIVQPLLDGLPDAAVVVGGDGVVRHANGLAERLFGIPIAELVGGPLSRLVPRRHRAAHGAWVADHVRSGAPRPMGAGELTAVHADGRELPVEISLAHWDVDGERLAIAMIRDVAERRRSRAELAAVLQHLPDAVWILDADGRVVYANLAVAEHAFHTLLGEPLTDQLPPGVRQAFDAMRRSVRDTGAANTFELVVPTAVGRRWYSTHVGPFDRAGEPSTVVISRDVSALREQDARLAEAQRVVALGVVAAGVAHELNNPLTAVLTNLAVLRERPMDADVVDILRDTTAAAERMRAIVADVSRFSRPERPATSGADLEAVVESTLRLLGPQLPIGCEIRRDYGSVPLVRGDEGRLAQIVLNLLLNAAQALREPVRTAALHVRTTEHDRHAVLEVQDTGPGMSPEVLGRLFTPFFTTRSDGTGLGLVITRRLVQGMGGRIDVSSVVGAGSTFRVTLPLAAVTTR